MPGVTMIRTRSRHRCVVIYLTIAFALAWTFWFLSWLNTRGILASVPIILTLILGSFAPFAGAAVCTWMEGGAAHAARFFARGLKWRMGWTAFLISFFFMPVLALAVEAIHAYLSDLPIHLNLRWEDLPIAYLWLLILGGAFAEEFGWSYLSDQFDVFWSPTHATFLLGSIWACWHIPLFFIVAPGLTQAYTPFPLFFILLVASRFMFSWTYHRSGTSILANLLFHNATNLAYEIVAIAPTPNDPSREKLELFVGFTCIAAVVLWNCFPLRGPATRESRSKKSD